MRQRYAKKAATWWTITVLSGYLLFTMTSPTWPKSLYSLTVGLLGAKAFSYSIAAVQEEPDKDDKS